jgi:high-affinity iron transporter
MIESAMITLREGLEAFLVVGIILAYLAKTNRQHFNRYVYIGCGAAIVASLAAAALFNVLSIEFSGRNEELFEGMVMLLAAGVLTSMIIWMTRESHLIKGRIEEQAAKSRALGLSILAFITVFREGIETVLFLAAAALNSDGSILAGAFIGLAASLAIVAVLSKSSVNLNVKTFFKVTSIFLIIFAAGLTAHGVHELQEAGVIPVVEEHVWDINHIFNEKSTAGSLAKSIFGYNGNPSAIEVASYIGYYLMVFGVIRRLKEGLPQNRQHPIGETV